MTKHGLARHPLYGIWFDMRRRCEDPNRRGYKDYGGSGITVCTRWASVAAFIEDMAPGYESGLEIDRIDSRGNYEPSNCRWVTRAEQAKNRKSVIWITLNGETKTLKDWSVALGLNYGTLKARVYDLGWTPEKAVTTPARSVRRA